MKNRTSLRAIFLNSLLLSPWMLLCPGAVAAPYTQDDLERLQGTWIIETSEAAGIKRTKDEENVTALVVKGSRITYHFKQGERGSATFTLNPARKPKALDLTYPNGWGTPTTVYGIYKLEGDTWTMCVADKRPTVLRAARDNSFMVLKRVKKK